MTTPSRSFSIRTVLMVLLIGEILAMVGITWWLWYRNGQRAVQEVEAQLREELTARIQQHILQLLSLPDRINQVNEDSYRLNRLDFDDVESLEPYLWRQIRAFPSISYIDVGTAKGEFIGVERMADGGINLELKTTRTRGALLTFRLDENGRRVSEKARPDYEPRGRPWYRAAVSAGEPTWTRVYPFFSLPARLGLAAVRPVYDAEGQLVGVLGCDLVLTHISQFLRGLKVGKTGRTFIIERNGLLVASSTASPPVRSIGAKVERVSSRSAVDPLIRAAAAHLERTYGRFDAIQESCQLAFEHEGERILLEAAPIREGRSLDWLSVVVVPESDFMGTIRAHTRTTVTLFLVLVLIAGLTIVFTTRKITRSILDVSREMNMIADFDVGTVTSEDSSLSEIRTMQTSMATMKRALRSFGKYVPTDVVRQLIRAKREAVLGVEPAEVTIFFSDVADFAAVSETVPHQQLAQIMGEYLDELSKIILQAGGTIDKYIGDAIMAFWNAPLPVEGHHRKAVEAALACQARIDRMNTKWATRGLPPLHTRIGLHAGPVLVGNLGSHDRMNYTVIGDAVNLASRIEGLNKMYGTRILITDTVCRQVGQGVLCRPVDIVAVKGRAEPTRIAEPIVSRVDATDEQFELAALYADALAHYERRAFRDARERFERYLTRVPGDAAAERLRARCADYDRHPPGAGWDGAYRWDQK